MANKSILRVQVSLRRVVNFNEEQPGHEEKSQTADKDTYTNGKIAKAQRSK
jgi:hypothetical protein